MRHGHLTAALQALAITIPLAAILALVMGELSWRIAIVAATLFAVVWVVMVGRSPKLHDSPSPDLTARSE